MNYFGNNNERSPYTQEGRFNFNPFEEHEIHDPREARTHPRTPSQPNQSDEDSLYYVRMNQLPPNIARSENIQLMRPKNDSASLNDPFQFGNSPTKIEAKKDGGDFFGFKGIFDKLNPFSKDEEPQNEKAERLISSILSLDKESEEMERDNENMKNENARMAMLLRELEDRMANLERCNQNMVSHSVLILDKVIKLK